MGYVPVNFPAPAPRNPIAVAIEALQSKGHQVAAADIPGLFFVDGTELTINQMMQFSGVDYSRL